MKIFKSFFQKNKQKIDDKEDINQVFDQYYEIGRLVKEARIEKQVSIKELSRISKIPEYVINSIENNIENSRPAYPFIRSILLKLEECLSLRKNILIDLLIKEKKYSKKDKKEFILRKFDFINTWEGSVLYFLILILTLFILKVYFFSNVSIIEIENVKEKINQKKDI